MHICFITSEYPKEGFSHGGVGSFIKTMALELVKNNFKVSIIGFNYENNYQEELYNNLHIYRLKPNNLKGFNWFLNAFDINNKLKEINSGNPLNVVETTELGQAFITKQDLIKYFIRLHGGHHFLAENGKTNWWKAFQEKRSFRKADAFIAVSNHVKTETEKYLSYNGKKIEQIYNPIDLNLFMPVDKIETNFFKILFVGTVYKKKGIQQLIDAFDIVKKQIPHATLEIYGKDWFFVDGTSFIEKIKTQKIYQLYINDITFHGAIKHLEIAEKYAQASVCVFPSLVEAQGLVVAEAMAMEKIVIFTEFGVGQEIIEHEKNGLLCDPKNPIDIAEKIIWSFNNQEKVTIIEKNARKTVLEKFNLEKIVQQNIMFYKNIVQND